MALLRVTLTDDVPLKKTCAVASNALPVMTTDVPTGPLVGEKLLIVGAARTVKLVKLVAVPYVVVTLMRPLEAPTGTSAVICVAELTVMLVAGVPLKLTLDEPSNPLPKTNTVVPTGPLAGAKVMLAGVTVKFEALVIVPAAVVTEIKPVVAPAGTATTICVSVFIVGAPAMPLKLTVVALASPEPLIVTSVPVGPLDGVKLEIEGD